jgi:hypothetical protein
MSLTNVPRLLSRVWSSPPGHVWCVVGSFSALAPLCLALLNGGQSTDTIVPKEEIASLFRHRRFVQLQAWDPNPQITKPANTQPMTAAEEETNREAQEAAVPPASASTSAAAVAGGEGEREQGGGEGAEGRPSPSASMALFSVLSWQGGEEEDGDAAVKRSAEQRAMQRWSRQRSHVQGQRTAVQRFTGTTQPSTSPAIFPAMPVPV